LGNEGLILSLFSRIDQEDWEKENLNQFATKSSDQYKTRRWIEEVEDIYRTNFQRDIGRILHSNPFRRLRTKTQVIYNPNDQHNRTRLTHSIEVSHLSRQVARTLRLNEDLVEAIALGHDLGHTPFGHAGERALNDALKENGGFSHNAQSVWIVEMCNQNQQINGKDIPGLNLTYAVREGILKHTEVTTNLDEYKKFFPEKPSTVEGQVVNICDSLAYLHHDIDDAIRNRYVSKREIEELWKASTNFEDNSWYHHMINDLVKNSYDKSEIKFSNDMKIVFKQMKNLIKDKVILSPAIKKLDDYGYELVRRMYDILCKYPEILPNNRINQYKLEKFGLERTVIDYIQWMSDQNFEDILLAYEKKVG
jgi:dGTPase